MGMNKKKVQRRSDIKPFLKGQLQPRDAYKVHRRDPLRQDQPQQGDPQGSDEEEEGAHDGEDQVRGEVQERQEQMVLPEAEILICTLVLKLLHDDQELRADYLNPVLFSE